MPTPLRIGTRGSRLAMWQAMYMADRLRNAHPGLDVRIEEFHTAGDRDRATPLVRMPGVGFFVKELESALLDGRIDLAVHSMKDVPTRLPGGLEVESSMPEREDVRDCLVTLAGLALAHLPQGAMVGSSSPRRRAMLRVVRPDLEFKDLRGNVETRLRKLEEGVCAATILARAGLGRLGVLDQRMVALEPDVLTPAAGQGSLGLEFRGDDARVRSLLVPLDHAATRLAVVAERSLVRRLGAGCQTPLGVLGSVDGVARLTLSAYLLSPDGRETLRHHRTGPAAEAVEIGHALAETMLAEGAARLVGSAAGGESGGAAEDGAADA